MDRKLQALLFVLALVAILVVFFILRLGLVKTQVLFEPDAFFYYTVIKQAIANNLHVSRYVNLSGFPWHNTIGEAPGLIYATLIPYSFLRYFGVSALNVMRFIPLFSGLLNMLGAYLLVKYLSKSRTLGLLSMLLIALSSANSSRTAALVYRGDTFITPIMLFALFFTFKALRSKVRNREYFYVIVSSFILSLGALIWEGSPYIIATYILGLAFLLIYGFLSGNEILLRKNIVFSLGLFLTFVLEHLYYLLGLVWDPIPLLGIDFFVFVIPIIALSVITYKIIKEKERYSILNSFGTRLFTVLIGLIVAASLFFLLLYQSFSSYLHGSGILGVEQAIGKTTQELQKPDFSFLFSNFNFQMFFGPLGILVFLLFADKISESEVYRFSKFKICISTPFLLLLAYAAVPAYLQINAVRFDAILSTPVAIFSAYAIYGIGKLLYSIKNKALNYLLTSVFSISVIYIVIFVIKPLRFLVAASFPAATSYLLSGVVLGLMLIYEAYLLYKKKLTTIYSFSALVVILVIYAFYNSYFYWYTAPAPDGLSFGFLSAMNWLSNNTSTNATVLAVWPDGSVAEGWGNRQSYMDSVGGENGTRIQRFSQFLFSQGEDGSYLYQINRPQYLIARKYWFAELSGLLQEGLVGNLSNYGYDQLLGTNITNRPNYTSYLFASAASLSLKVDVVFYRTANGTSSVYAFIGNSSNMSNLLPIRNVVIYNQKTLNYTLIVSSNPASLNYSAIVTISNRTITAASLLGPSLLYSNLFRFSVLCGYYQCPYHNNNVTMNLVFANNDTRIIKINYLK